MIDAETQLYGVIGNPVRHSLSPIIHNGAFQRMGLNAAYLAFEVNHLEEAVKGIKGLGIRGVSVTIPFRPGSSLSSTNWMRWLERSRMKSLLDRMENQLFGQ
jgi:hypothetical protein